LKKVLELCNRSSVKKIIDVLFLIVLSGCVSPLPATPTLVSLPEGCVVPGEIVRAELSHPKRGYPYTYRVYLPPCFSTEAEVRYPVLYLIPGRSSSPDAWFQRGLPEKVSQLILAGEIPPLIIVATENIDFDPNAETIYQELIPFVESQHPILADRRYRAVAGGSLGGIAAYRLAFRFPDTFSSAGIFGAGAISGEETQIRSWLSQMDAASRPRVFMNSGQADPFMLERARVMKSLLDEAGVENQLYVDEGGHNYTDWVVNFEMYLQWLSKDW
jgi:enterochelin esterase-like enzyme